MSSALLTKRFRTDRRAIGFLIAVFSIAAGFFLFPRRGPAAPPRWKQLVFITIDTLRADHLGSYGYPRPASPFLDRLASEGTVFEHAYSASSHTAPSHATMFTSRYPFEHGLLENGPRLSPKVTTLHDTLLQAGFQSGAFPAVLFLNGAVGFPITPWKTPLKRNGKPFLYKDAAAIVDEAVGWLGSRTAKDRLFLWLHFYDVHEWRRKNLLSKEALQKIRAMPSEFSEEQISARRPQDGYDAQLLHVDAQIERLHRQLDSLGFGESALWIITADHGEGLGNHKYRGHGKFIYQEQLHVPLIFWGKGLPPGKREPGIVRTVDYVPTIRAALGISSEENQGIRGHSLLAPSLEESRSAMFSYAQRRPKDDSPVRKDWEDGEVYSIHDLNYKYIFRTSAPSELYDLRSDPREQHNLIETHPGIARELEAKLFSLRPRGADTPSGDNEPVDPKVLEELKSLGYL